MIGGKHKCSEHPPHTQKNQKKALATDLYYLKPFPEIHFAT